MREVQLVFWFSPDGQEREVDILAKIFRELSTAFWLAGAWTKGFPGSD
jgi:hypothetical protein